MFYTACEKFTFADADKYRFIGRTDESFEGGVPISWSNSGLTFCFCGDRAVLHFGGYLSDQPVYVKVFADNMTQRFCLDGKSPKILLDFDEETAHTVKLLRVSEGNTPLVFYEACVYGKAPALLPPPAEKPLRIEFMGDSITAGYGVAAPRSQNVYTTYEQDSTRAYAYMTAERLNAEVRTVCISGQGVWRNCNGDVGFRFESIFDMCVRGKDGYDHSKWQPDIMVLNCGTNDVPGGATNEIMYEEGGKLLDQVRAAYPNAQIVWMYGMMNDKFSEILAKLIDDRKAAGDAKLHYFPVSSIYSHDDEVGAVGHPNVNASVRVSEALAGFLAGIVTV